MVYLKKSMVIIIKSYDNYQTCVTVIMNNNRTTEIFAALITQE